MSSKHLSLPPLAAVRVFETVVRHRSFTRAAEELGMTQAAVSYQIKQLEQRLGVTLLLRDARKLELTEAGARLSAPVSDALGILRGAFADLVRRSEHELAITSLPTIASNWLVPRLGAFRTAHPELEVRLETSVPLVELAQSEFDIGIRIGRGNWPELTAEVLLPNLYAPLCSPALVDSGVLRTPADLLKVPLMGRRSWWHAWLTRAGVPDPDLSKSPGVELAVEQFEVTAAIAGHGVAITSPLFFENEIVAGRLVQPFELVMRDERDYWLAYPTARRRHAKIQAFRNWVLAEAAQHRTRAEQQARFERKIT